MPPKLSSHDRARVPKRPEDVTLDASIRLTSRNVCRLVIEEGVAALYTSSQNARRFRGHEEPQHIDFALEAAPALEAIIKAYPKYTTVRRLPADSDDQRLDIARALAEAQLLLLKPTKAAGGAAAAK